MIQIFAYLDRNADDDEQKIGRGEGCEEHIRGALHAPVAHDGEYDQRVAQHPQHQGQPVHDQGRHQLVPEENVARFLKVVVVIVVGGRISARIARRQIHFSPDSS